MKILVLGANGKTGKHLVEQLLLRNQSVKIIVRASANIAQSWIYDDRIEIVKADISYMTIDEAAHHIKDCRAIASCLGHNMSLKGIYGKPRKLVSATVALFCEAIKRSMLERPIKFVLMNTAGYRNKDNNEQISLLQKIAMAVIRKALPPHLDNEKAAEYLRKNIGKDSSKIQWVVVRPDNLITEDAVSVYDAELSPTSTLFNPYRVSRINVAHFMANLIKEPELWTKWRGKMPVIFNSAKHTSEM